MGKTVPTYRMAIEWEMQTWKPFYKSLSEDEKEAFNILMDACRSFAMEASNACKPILFQPMTISMILYHQKEIMKLEQTLRDLKGKQIADSCKP